MKKTNMITIVYYLTIKFLTPTKIRYVKANQATARQCHLQSLQLSNKAMTKLTEVIARDVLAIGQRVGKDITLDSLDLREEYIKP